MVEKLYYSIGEVAERLGVNPSLIRFWEKEFPEIRPQKTSKGNRQFTIQDISLLENIYRLVKVEGFTLAGAREHLKEKKHSPDSHPLVIRKLRSIKADLESIARNLEDSEIPPGQ